MVGCWGGATAACAGAGAGAAYCAATNSLFFLVLVCFLSSDANLYAIDAVLADRFASLLTDEALLD